jgi:hypothetical protein
MITPHWTVKVKTTFEDPETEKVKSKKESFLVAAPTIEASQERVRAYFKDTTIDYDIISVVKSNIVDYIGIDDEEL